MSITKIRRVYQKTMETRNGCCLPACISSLTGIPLREISYQPRARGKCWQTHIRSYLKTKGFNFEAIGLEKVQGNNHYLMIYEYTVDDEDMCTHAVISRGREICHDPGKFIRKHLLPQDCVVTYGKQYFLKVE